MHAYTRNIIIVPKARASACNAALEDAGFGPNNLSRELNVRGNTAAATHYMADWTDHEGRWERISPIVAGYAGASINLVHSIHRPKGEEEDALEDVLSTKSLQMRIVT